ncbi:helix-turn-helix domain-containing protein [Streptomyces sp. NPDC051569]|uniref:helix-turn-helix domain-containing protein n=1 Tax=Streptomyces sp. NPDC051569 TaxID=3365661 RepID=UPI0037B7FD81
MDTTTTSSAHGRHPLVGQLLRDWRGRRRLSQLQLALDTDISTRHLSFIETGRSRPSGDMILRIAEQLDVPLRERNRLLLAGGYAPVYRESALDAPEMSTVRGALRQILAGHDPYPALIVDRGWNLVDANAGIELFTRGVAEDLLAEPLNVLRLSLHPEGMAPRIVNLGDWRAHLLGRLHRQMVATEDAGLIELYKELSAYPSVRSHGRTEPEAHPLGAADVVVPLRYRHGERELSFFSMTALFGTPLAVAIEDLAIESFYPADEATARALLDLRAEAEGPSAR